MSRTKTLSTPVEVTGDDFHFALNMHDEVLIVCQATTINLGDIAVASDKMRQFIQLACQDNWVWPAEKHRYAG